MDTLEPEAAYIQKQITGAKRDKIFLCADSIQTVQKLGFFKSYIYIVKAEDCPNSVRIFQAKHLHSVKSHRCHFSMVQFLLPLDCVTLRDCTFQSE